MRSLSNPGACVKSPVIRTAARLPRHVEDDPYAWLYDLQRLLGSSLSCTAKSVVMALWQRAIDNRYQFTGHLLTTEVGLGSEQVLLFELSRLGEMGLISLHDSGPGYRFYLLPVKTARCQALTSASTSS